MRRRYDGKFFGRRVNCEHVPLLPATPVSRMLDDPRKIPYLLIWRSREDSTVQEAVRIVAYRESTSLGGLVWSGAVEIKRSDQTRNFIRTVTRPLPRNGGRVRFLICPYCQRARRGLYAWEPGGEYTHSALRSNWACRKCNQLRYASEGGALRPRYRGYIGAWLRSLGDPPLERPEPWYPWVFTDADEAMRWIRAAQS